MKDAPGIDPSLFFDDEGKVYYTGNGRPVDNAPDSKKRHIWLQELEVAIENLTGVRSVINLITVKAKISPTDIQQKISAAFHRSATIDAEKIQSEVVGNKVTLRGKVRSFAEKEDAENAAWAAPGITSVENKLQIEVPEYAFEE